MSPFTALESWYAVDLAGRDLATGRDPSSGGAASPAGALAAAPVVTWPPAVLSAGGRRRRLGAALGAGGDAVEQLLDRLVARPSATALDVASLATATPTGPADLPLSVVGLAEGVARSAGVDPSWLAAVDQRRAAARPLLVAAGRSEELEAALHVAMLVATEVLDPVADADVDAHIASGAQLWLLGAAVAWALAAGGTDHPFAPWAELVSAGLWPVGPSCGQLVVAVVAPR
ncbi:MAG TPA: hypothetical protein VGV63_03535 [Acidimicrobiales bacterium]|nr:hypothetical protein [Acidimicrobiales bacterium]